MLWSWLLTAGGVTGLVLAGRWPRCGWLVGLAMQPLWAVYAATTDQWGFLVAAFLYGSANALNARRAWKRKRRQ